MAGTNRLGLFAVASAVGAIAPAVGGTRGARAAVFALGADRLIGLVDLLHAPGILYPGRCPAGRVVQYLQFHDPRGAAFVAGDARAAPLRAETRGARRPQFRRRGFDDGDGKPQPHRKERCWVQEMWVTPFRPNLFIRSIFTKKALCLLPVRETM